VVLSRTPVVPVSQVSLVRGLTLANCSRLWILQEAVVSPVNICYLGALLPCPLILLLRTVNWLEFRGQIPRAATSDSYAGSTGILSLFALADREIGTLALRSFKPSFGYLLSTAMKLERSEPRDGVFAVLGLLSE